MVVLKITMIFSSYYIYSFLQLTNEIFKNMTKFTSFLLLLSLLIVSCQNADTAKTSATESTTPTATTPAKPAPDGKKYRLTPVNSKVEYPNAKLEYGYYSDGQFGFDVQNYQLGAPTADANSLNCANSGSGQHIHLIFDKEPYVAKYKNVFDHSQADGIYYMMAFLGKSYHESIKSKDAFVAHRVSVRDNSVFARSDIKDPVLFYSRPKGTYVGKDAEKVMLDFYLLNCDLENSAYKVYVDINGERHLIDKWQSYFIEGLPYGENIITLTLVYNSGEIVPSRRGLNPVTRKIILKKNPVVG